MEYQNYELKYHGKSMDYFKIWLVNIILTTLTLGLYYPWARARTLEYLYSQSTFDEQPFSFIGTGKEMFIGFIKAWAILILMYTLLIYGQIMANSNPLIFLICFLSFFFFWIIIIPLAIHGTLKYRLAKTIWKGIRFGYTGSRSELFWLFIKGFFLTIITFGIYGAWFSIDLRKYIFKHVQCGNATFDYKGSGSDFFVMNLVGYLLTWVTLGIYFFWWQKNIFNFFVDNTSVHQGDKGIYFRSHATGGKFAGLILSNLLIIIVTLGFGLPIVTTRTLRFYANQVESRGNYNFDELLQTQQDYSDATGADILTMLDFNL